MTRKRAQARRAVRVNARTVEVESGGGSEPGDVTWYYPVVTFTIDGNPVRVKLPKATVRREDYRVGSTIKAYYDSRDPTQAAARYKSSRAAG